MANPIQHIKTSFSAGELTPSMGGRVDIGKYQIGAELMENMYTEIYGSASNRSGTKFIAETKGSDEAFLKEFKFSSDDVYILVFTPNTIRFIFDGGIVQDGPGDLEVTTPWGDWETIRQLTFAQSADVMWICSPTSERVQELKRFGPTSWTLTDFTDAPDAGLTPQGFTVAPRQNSIKGLMTAARNSGGSYADITVDAVSDTPPGIGSIIVQLGGNPSEEIDYISWKEISGVYTFTFETNWVPNETYPNNHPANVARSQHEYQITGIKNGQESLPTTPDSKPSAPEISATFSITLTWSVPSAGASDSYNIYRKEQGAFYWIGTTQDLTFVDDGFEFDAATSPPGPSILPADKYLRCVAMFSQRLMFANGTGKPNTLWASQTGIFNDFGKSFIAKDTDAFERTLDSGVVNEIRHMIQIGNQLIALTSGGTWSVGSADSVSFNLDTVTASYQGDISASKYVRPLVVQNDVMVVQDKGQVVSPLTYNLDQNGYVSNDVSIWSKHLFDGHEIVDWCYQKSPSSIIWMVRDDGIIIGLTYLKEQEVWAFHQHNTGKRLDGDDTIMDKVISIESISNSTENVDEVYMCVERVIDGNTVRYLEMMVKRDASNGLGFDTWFSDCGASASGLGGVSVIGGLSHLEGREVVGLGWITGEKPGTIGGTVTGGQVDISPASVDNVIIGLPMVSALKTMRLSSGDIWNTLQGKKKKIVECTVRCQDTTSFEIAQNVDDFFAAKGINIDTNDTGVASLDSKESVPGGMTYDGYVHIRNVNPTPISIQCLIMKIDN